ncbi:putative quinol monooxygenase [Nodularia spumigena]|uniref:putative quinol monooxygenase n=1 Tax=Nodularia spumigena TaxID=70799 RepID=UPI002B2046A5|nr:putative quinol monooxygenase [Nodularia spumigena]MEA5614876.1 putative quinol monooxygenase [Nodularia spumigena UHCC 0040]
MQQHVRVLAHFVATPDQIEALRSLLVSLLEPTRAEEGCLQYDLWRSRTDPARFTLVEEWTDDGCLDRHLSAPHLEHAKGLFPGLLAEPLRIDRCDLVG